MSNQTCLQRMSVFRRKQTPADPYRISFHHMKRDRYFISQPRSITCRIPRKTVPTRSVKIRCSYEDAQLRFHLEGASYACGTRIIALCHCSDGLCLWSTQCICIPSPSFLKYAPCPVGRFVTVEPEAVCEDIGHIRSCVV